MTVLLAVGVMVLSAAFLGLRVLFGKDEEVRRPGCSNANAFMDDQEACPICGVVAGASCENEPAAPPRTAGQTRAAAD
jgi:hypothetical protein